MFVSNRFLKAAEIINIKFEEMIIPISIEQLSNLGNYKEDSTELTEWIKSTGLKRIFELSTILEYPVFNERGFSKQIFNSWIGRQVLAELENTITVPDDNEGTIVLNTIKDLLDFQEEVSTLDILRSIPNKEIDLNVDNLLIIVALWKKDLSNQQNLVEKLNQIEKSDEDFYLNTEDDFIKVETIKKEIFVSHRNEPLLLELWKPINKSDKDLIIFMPGLGGKIADFHWIGYELSQRGWPVIFIDHAGSNFSTLKEVIEGKNELPGARDIYINRLLDLQAVITSHDSNQFDLGNNSYILMGHSLGALISFLHEGKFIDTNFESICDDAFSDLALTNLSKLLQCQLTNVSLPVINSNSNLRAIVGFNSFGSLIWTQDKSSEIDVPILLIGGTFDLITPLMGEQFNLFLMNSENSLNRFLVIEGASHFSPIRIEGQNFLEENKNDVFKINQTFIGADPFDVQNLSAEVIVQFLYGLEVNQGLPTISQEYKSELDFHILDLEEVKKIFQN